MTATKPAEPEFTKLGENVFAAVVDDEIVIKIKVDHRHDTDAAKKTIRVASTLGNKEVDGAEGVIVGINAYVYRNPR